MSRYNLVLILFGISFIVNSCKEKSFLGTESQPPIDNINVFQSDTFGIISYQGFSDSLITSNLNTLGLGNYFDPIWGNIYESFYIQMTLPQEQFSLNLDSLITLDSVFINIPYSGNYLDSNITNMQDIAVYRLDKRLVTDSNYYSSNNQGITHYTDILNFGGVATSINIKNLKDSISIFTKKATPSLRIRLKDAFGDSLISFQGTDVFSSSSKFLDRINGFMVSSLSTNSRSLIYLDKTSANLELHYHGYKNSVLYDSLYTFFYYNSSTCKSFTQVNRNIRNVISTTAQDSIVGRDKLYLSAKPGIVINVKIPKINSLQNYLINEAEILFSSPNPPANFPFGITKNILGRKIYTPDSLNLTQDYLSFYLGTQSSELALEYVDGNRSENGTNYYTYRYRITKELFKSIQKQEDLYLQFSTLDLSNYLPISGNGTEFIGNNTTSPNKLKLKITYSKLK